MAIKKTMTKMFTKKTSNGDDEKRRKKLENAYMSQNNGVKPPKDAVLVPSSEANFQKGTGAYKVYIKPNKPAANASQIKPKATTTKKKAN